MPIFLHCRASNLNPPWFNVPRFIAKHGGKPLTGYHVIVHHAEYYALVIPHVIVATDEGYHDVTPPDKGETVLFLPKNGVSIESDGCFLRLSDKRKAKPAIDAAWKIFKMNNLWRQRTL